MNIPKKYLTEKVILIEARIDSMSILRILTQNKQINRADADNYYVQLADWANSRQDKTGKIDLTTIKLSDRSLVQKGKLANNTKHLGATLEQLKSLMDREGKYNPKSELSNLIQKTTLEILAEMSSIKNPKPQADDLEDGQKLYAGMDWTAEKARRLENADGKATSKILDKFYNDYYKIEYAGLKSAKDNDTTGIVAKLKSLDKILIQEFNKLGYNPSVNPLAQFLKILIEHSQDLKIFDKLSTNTYGAIHNAFIDKDITGNMLGNFDDKNILFCTDLYNYKGLDIVKYLSYQNNILAAAKANSSYSEDPWSLTMKVLIHQDEAGTTYEEKVDNLLKLPKPKTPTASGAKLRSALEITELYTYLFKDKLASTKTDEEKDKDALIKTIVSLAKINKVPLDMIRHILNQDGFKKAFQKESAKYEERLTQLSYKQNDEKLKASRNIFNDILSKGHKLDNKDLLTIISRLFSIYSKTSKKVKS